MALRLLVVALIACGGEHEVVGDRILDLRFVASAPAHLDAPDVVAFFQPAG